MSPPYRIGRPSCRHLGSIDSWSRNRIDCLPSSISVVRESAQSRRQRPCHRLSLDSTGMEVAPDRALQGEVRVDKGSEGFKTAAAHAVPGHAGFDYLIVGAGFAGSVMADDSPPLPASACSSSTSARTSAATPTTSTTMRRAGPPVRPAHLPYQLDRDLRVPLPVHRMAAVSAPGARQRGRAQVPIPINLDTVNRLYGLNLTSFEMEGWFARSRRRRTRILTSEDAVVSKVGRDLYNKFFRGYTRKHWGLDASELDASVTSRMPTRTNRDDRYFTDTYQVDAPAWLHAHVREHAAPPEYQGHAEHRLSGGRGPDPLGSHDLHRADRCVLQSSPRQASVPQPRVPSRQPAAGAVPADGHGELPERLRLHPDHRVQASHRAATSDDLDRLRVSARRRRPLLSDSAAGEAAIYQRYEARPKP